MTVPDAPHDFERLKVLETTGLLSEPAPEEFHEVCQSARTRFGVPIALVTLVGQDRLIFKAGLGTGLGEAPRLHQFCDRTIQGDDVLVVQDALDDPRFSANPLVRAGPHIRFYAGAPLHYVRNIRLGALCLLDTRPRDLSDAERTDLERMAEAVSGAIVSRAFERIARSLAH